MKTKAPKNVEITTPNVKLAFQYGSFQTFSVCMYEFNGT